MARSLRLLLLLLVAALVLMGCGSKEVYTVKHESYMLTVDTVNGTIFDGVDTYSYTVSGDAVTITSPNGATYCQGATTGEYDAHRYIPGETLLKVLPSDSEEAEIQTGNPLIGSVLIAIGVVNFILPKAAWYISSGWRNRETEPSETTLKASRIVGLIAIVAGIVTYFM